MVAYALGWVPKVISNASKHKPDLDCCYFEDVEDCPPAVHERQHRALMARPDATAYLPDLCFPVLLLTVPKITWPQALRTKRSPGF
ncbi:hypothetical protein F2981_28345 (plasmid) [Sinorhizobium meliloti]|nr:hypothetical protein [Sinorhizobium meliloti]